MGFRESIANNPVAAKLFAALLILLCAAVIFAEYRTLQPRIPAGAGKVFYSDDDGTSWFLDDPAKGSPFDHNGKPAYRALIFRCHAGKPFVAFLAEFSDRQKSQMSSESRPPTAWMPMQNLKKPGESKWMTNSTASMTGYPDVPCPDGGGPAAMVAPTDPDSGATNWVPRVDYRIERNTDRSFRLFTTGLEPMGMMEIEIPSITMNPAELRDWAINITYYLIEKGPVLKHGNTIGIDAKHQMRVAHGPSMFARPSKNPVIRIENP